MNGLPTYFIHLFGDGIRKSYAQNTGKELEFGILYEILEDSQSRLVLLPLREIDGFVLQKPIPNGIESKLCFFNAENHIDKWLNLAKGVLIEYALETNDFKCPIQDCAILFGKEIANQGTKTVIKQNGIAN